MNKSVLENRWMLLVFHQACAIATAISLYIYDYIIIRNQERNEIGYLVVSLIAMIGSVVSFILFCRFEVVVGKNGHKQRLIDRLVIEGLLVGAGVLLASLVGLLREIDITDFSLAGLSVTIGTIAYLIDVVIISTASSIYRRIVRKQIKTNSLIHMVWRILKNY